MGEVLGFPQSDNTQGEAKYFIGEKLCLHFRFTGGEECQSFSCQTVDNTNSRFSLTPVLRGDFPVGFKLSFPESDTLEAVLESKHARRRSSVFGRWQRNMTHFQGTHVHRSVTAPKGFAKWQIEFAARRKL